MKRWIAWMLTVLLVLSLAACGKSTGPSLAEQMESRPAVEQQTETSEPKPSQPVKPEQPEEEKKTEKEEEPKKEPKPKQEDSAPLGDYTAYDGTYRLAEQKMEGEDTYVVVRGFPEFLLIECFTEYEGSVYSFWVEEFWPDEDVVLGESAELLGKSQDFSLMTRGNIYTALPSRRTVTLTEAGITLHTEGFAEEVYLRVEDYSYHTPEAELLDRLHEMFTIREESAPVGVWEIWDGWRTVHVTLEEDGGFHFVSKEPGCPIRVMDGVWGVDADTGDIQVVAELAGDGNYPYHITLFWRMDDNGYLYLWDEYGDLLPQTGNDMAFWTAEEEVYLNMTQLTAMGYVWNYYDLSGEYTDQYDMDYYYSYRLPLFLEEEGDLGAINNAIMDKFVPIIEEELAAMEIGEFITAQNVDYNIYITEGILTLYIHSFSWEWEEHQTYYYDLQTGRRTDSRELLRRIGMDETEFLETVRDAAEAYYIETFSEVPMEDRQDYGYYDLLEWTVSDEAVNFDLPIFVDAVGNLCVMARIGSIAGASEFWAPLYPFADWNMYEEAVG